MGGLGFRDWRDGARVLKELKEMGGFLEREVLIREKFGMWRGLKFLLGF